MVLEKVKNLAMHALEGYFTNASGPVCEDVLMGGVSIVWFTETMEMWKAQVAVLGRPGLYLEITYDNRRKQSYVDFYTKVMNVCITDEVYDFKFWGK